MEPSNSKGRTTMGSEMASPFNGRTGNAEIDRIIGPVKDYLQQYEDVRGQLAELRGRGESQSGRVVVEVMPNGMLSDLRLDPRALRLGSEELSAAILEAARIAAQDGA